MLLNIIFDRINNIKNHRYYYLSPHVYAVGNCAEDIYCGLIKARSQSKKLVILYMLDIPYIFKYKLTNKYLFTLKSDHIYKPNSYILFFIRLLLTLVYIPLRTTALFSKNILGVRMDESYNYPLIGRDKLYAPKSIGGAFDYRYASLYNWKDKFNYEFDFIINNKTDDEVLNYLSESRIVPKNAWFVCLHVRENGFRNDKGRREYRNSNIENYIPAIKEITSKGGYVIRMGDDSMTPIPNMKNVIDYPFTKFKSDYMDLFLIKYCYFFIGCQSGIFDVAKLFGKPVLLLNMYNWTFGGPLHSNDSGILKHIYSKKDNRYLSIKELFSGGWETQNMNGYIDDFIFIENTKEEILDAVVSYIQNIDNDTFFVSKIQNLSNSFRKKQAYSIFKNNRLAPKNVMNTKEEMVERYRFASQIEGASGFICKNYLEKNWERDSLNK